LDRWTPATGVVPESVRNACLSRIETRYHARFQARTIELALSGAPAASVGEAVPAGIAP
jgi:hypothetical protein